MASTFSWKNPSRAATAAEELVELADRKNLKIMVDHTFLFTGAVKKIRQMVDDGELGDLYYYDHCGEFGIVSARRERYLGFWRRMIFPSWTM